MTREELKAAIDAAITTNGVGDISGADLNTILDSIVDGALFAEDQKQSIGPTLAIPFDKHETLIDPLTISGPTEFTVNTINAKYLNGALQRLTANGVNTPIWASPFQKSLSSKNYNNTLGAVNIVGYLLDGVSYIYSIIQIESVSAPLLSSIAVASDNGSVVITGDQALYANNDATGDLLVADFTPSLNGGTATNPVLSAPTHSAGDSTAGFTLSYDGVADGSEVLTITPADGASVYGLTGVPMDAGQSEDDNLKDQTAPSFNSAEVGAIDDTTIRITMDEACDPASTPATSAFTPAGIASTPTVTVVNITGVFIDLTLSAAVVGSDTPTIAYTKPGSNFLKDTASTPNETVSWTAEAVTNNVSGYAFANTHSMLTPTTAEGAEIVADTFYPKNGGEQAFTFEVWIKTPADISAAGNFLPELINGNSNLIVNILITDSGALRFKIRNTGTNYFQYGTAISFMSNSTWYHIVGVYKGDYTQGAASMAMYLNGVSEGNYTTGGTFTGIEDLSAGSKLALPVAGSSNGYKFNFARWYDGDMSANIATMYNSGVVPDLSGEGFFSNVVSEMPFNNDLTALVGPDGTEVGSPTYDTDIPS